MKILNWWKSKKKKVMKVRLLENGKIYKAKRYKNMTNEERLNSTDGTYGWKNESIFTEPKSCGATTCWHYVFPYEIEIISEASI